MTTKSQLAANDIVEKAGQHEEILGLISRHRAWGLTNDDIAAATGLAQNVISARITELRVLGQVCDSTLERVGLAGVSQAVWTIGDDRHVVRAHRVRKLRKLADDLGYDLVERQA